MENFSALLSPVMSNFGIFGTPLLFLDRKLGCEEKVSSSELAHRNSELKQTLNSNSRTSKLQFGRQRKARSRSMAFAFINFAPISFTSSASPGLIDIREAIHFGDQFLTWPRITPSAN